LISKGSALLRLKPELITQLLHPTLDVSSTDRWQRLTRGLPAYPGAAAGKVVFTADEAEKRSRNGEKAVGISWDFMGLLIFWVDLDRFLLGVRDGTCWDLAIFSWIGWFFGGGFG
jgi:hypothetical protein